MKHFTGHIHLQDRTASITLSCCLSLSQFSRCILALSISFSSQSSLVEGAPTFQLENLRYLLSCVQRIEGITAELEWIVPERIDGALDLKLV